MELDLFTQLAQKVETLEEKVGTLEKQLIIQTELLEKTGITDDFNTETYAPPIGDFDFRITALLQELRIPANIKGYAYLRESIKLAYQDEDMLRVSKTLYPMLANKFRTTPSRAERAIRHAIQTSWYKCKHSSFYHHYEDKPTNSQFIADIVDMYKLEENGKIASGGHL